jgi:FixJ family two-component response regulator
MKGGATPYIEEPVPAEDFLDAVIRMDKNEPITNTRSKPSRKGLSKFLPLGLSKKSSMRHL